MLAGALLIWQIRDTLRPAMFAIWLLLVALLNARHRDVMMLSGALLCQLAGTGLQAGRWFVPAYALHLLCIGFMVNVL